MPGKKSRKAAAKRTAGAARCTAAGAEPMFERVPWAAAGKRFHVAGNSEEPEDLVLVHHGNLCLAGNLELDYRTGLLEGEPPIVGLLVDGDLTLEGCLANFEDDFGPCLQVTGSLVAQSVATGGSQMRVDGNLTAKVVVGVYNHGCLDVGGDLSAELIASEHTVSVAGKVNALRYLGWGGSAYRVRDDVPDEDDPYDVAGIFPRALLDGDSVDLRKARRLCVQGKPVLRDELVSVRQQLRKALGKKLESPEKVKSLAITSKDLTCLPDELLAFPNLEKLDLAHNRIRVLPEWIGKLTHLRELHVRGNGLQRLPDSIGQCRELTVLDLEANCLVSLPDSLAACEQLREVNLCNQPYSYVSASFGGWDKIQLMDELPAVLTRLPRLTKLNFDDTMIRRLPPVPFASPDLEKVTYEDTLLTEVDVSLHPKIAKPSLAATRRWAVAHIGFWFDDECVNEELFYDPRTRAYDFTEARALLRLVLHTLVPAAAPYKEAVAAFDKECKGIVRRLGWDKDLGKAHQQALFTALLAELDAHAAELETPALVDGVRKVFAKLAG